MQDQSSPVEWRDGQVPVSTRFDDPYYSLDNGLAETRHVFLAGNDLPARFCPGFHVAELGFGTGLNLLAAWAAWRGAGVPGTLYYTSFEAFPLSIGDMQTALRTFPSLSSLTERLLEQAPTTTGTYDLGEVRLNLIVGDARSTLPGWQDHANAWFLDGFSPAKNPELWEPEVMAHVAAHTAPGGTAATYTAAGHVRRALEHAGFVVTRAPGFGRKRHMTRATLQ